MVLECLTCHGVYIDEQDGVRYFHVCPTLSSVELAAAVAAGVVQLPIDPFTKQTETVDVAVRRRSYERANKRDERPDLAQTPGATGYPIRAAGLGVQRRPDLEAAAAPVTVDTSQLPPAAPALP